jgi:hypothetical protein
MQKWEYLRLDVFYKDPKSEKEFGVKSVVVNYNEVLSNIAFTDLHGYINKLGGEGWEMVSDKAGVGQPHGSYYFKRPI